MGTYPSSKKTYDGLIDAAGQLAAEYGFSSVSMRAVAERAGENIGSIHYHFGSKENLFEKVVMEATRLGRENPVSDIVDAYKDRLDSPKVQSRVLRKLVHRYISLLFNPASPSWHKRVIYQSLQFAGPLRDLLMKQVGDPDIKSMANFIKMIKPDLPDEDAFLHTFIIQAPVIFHSNFTEPILGQLGKKEFDAEYLNRMEDLIVRQAQWILGLPGDKDIPQNK
jgi:AcrR family transcriptional regulator